MIHPELNTILIVDDNPTNLRILVDYLRECGYKTLVATGGERALLQLEHVQPDLILLDVMMPGLDGFETCRRIRAEPTLTDIPVIFMTALVDTEHKLRGFEAGAVDYITKPFQQEEVSARISTHLTIRRQQQALEQLNETKDRLFAIIGHDLRGLFTSILGFSEIFADPERELSKAQSDRFGALLYQSTRNALNLLENLLAWATLEQNAIKFQPQLVDFARIIDESCDLMELGANSKEITLSHDVSPDTLVFVDVNMVSTILRNLISNAIKFTPAGGAITVTTGGDAKMLEVRIQDTGVGITADLVKDLLSRDVRQSLVGTEGESGSGLGLLLCKDFVTRNGGRLWIESAEGQGSTFYFTLPRRKPEQPDKADLTESSRLTHTEDSWTRENGD